LDKKRPFLSIGEHILYGLAVSGVTIFIDFLRGFRVKNKQNMDKKAVFYPRFWVSIQR